MGENEIMWMVRSGRGAIHAEVFEEKSIVALGWKETGDLSSITNKSDIEAKVRSAYTDAKSGWIYSATGQLSRFKLDMNIGDRIITYVPDRRVYLVGTITGNYRWDESQLEGFPHVRSVEWKKEVARDSLTPGARNSLGSAISLFVIPDEVVEQLDQLIAGVPAQEQAASTNEESDELKQDIVERSHEFIKDKILALDWDEMQDLVAGLLRAMGYKTLVSPKGADRGKDVMASPDGLGLDSPRIFVEVKHRSGTKISADLIRSFLGGRRPTDSCLYVSTGGYSKDAHYEAERSNIPLTLVDSDGLVNLVVQYYESMDNDTRALIPLQKIYWPT